MSISLSHAHETKAQPALSRITLIVCVAGSASDRARLSGLVDHDVHVLFVSNADDVPRVIRGVATTESANGDSVVRLPALRLDSDRRVATWFGQEVALTPLEHDLLRCLLSKPGRTWSFEALYEAVWTTQYLGNRAEIHSLVKRLRGKLTHLNKSVAIEAIRGVGFRLALPDAS